MNTPFPFKSLAVAIALSVGAAAPAMAVTNAELADMLEKLTARVQQLEKANAELQKQLEQSKGEAPAEPAGAATATAKGEPPAADPKQPDVETRLKALEAKIPDGITGGLNLVMVAQKSYAPSVNDSQLGYRADAFVTLPLPKVGESEQSIYAQLRMGQGAGITGLPSYSKPNATAFQIAGGLRGDDAVPLVAQLFYQASVPLKLGGGADSKQAFEVTVGKMDPFFFFDQNAIAADETHQFMNNVFVHNPMLDAGGDIGVDANGFTPGVRLALVDSNDKQEGWRVSLGLTGAGSTGANYQRSLGAPLVMLQLETSQRWWNGHLGNYRLYTWSNPQASNFDTTITAPEVHTGWGLSLDQQVSDSVVLFTRYGHQTSGNVKFDRAITLGGEFSGVGGENGAVGLALGWLRTNDAYRDFTLATTGISGMERVAELYYRYKVSKQFELSPSMQFIGNPGGDPAAQNVRILGLRSQFSF